MLNEQIKELFNKHILAPQQHGATFFLYENGKILAILEEHKLMKLYGNYKAEQVLSEKEVSSEISKLPVVKTDSVHIHVIPPKVIWYNTPEEIEYVGFTDTSEAGSDHVEGFFTYCVGYSNETSYIYVDIGYNEESDEYRVLSENNFDGRGYKDVPVHIPEEIVKQLLSMSINKNLSFYAENPMFKDIDRE